MSFGFGLSFPRALLKAAAASLFGLFIPLGSDKLITSDGKTFRVPE